MSELFNSDTFGHSDKYTPSLQQVKVRPITLRFKMQSSLHEHADVDLTPSASIEEMARREGWAPDFYALGLAHAIRDDNVPLDAQRQRLAALSSIAPGLGDKASADELARHYIVLNALFDRLAWASGKASQQQGNVNNAAATEKLATGAIKCQRAAVAALSALKVLRDGNNAITNDGNEINPLD